MKIRTGFVSNSSTSSFIVIGIQMKKFTKNYSIRSIFISDFYHEHKDHFEHMEGSEDGVEGTVIGKTVVCMGSEDGGMEDGSLKIKEIVKIGEELKKKTGLDGEVKVIYGTRMS